MVGMPRIAVLTLETIDDFVIDDDLAVTELQRRGWHAAEIPWSVATDWNAYDLVLIRSTWDYASRDAEFLDTLRVIEPSLSLRMSTAAPMRFADAIEALYARRQLHQLHQH